MNENRCRLARERAGLSVGQAAKLLGMERDELLQIEDPATSNFPAEQLADVYGVNVEWLEGRIPQYDYLTVDRIRGSEILTGHDRDTIAEFAASMSRKPNRKLSEVMADAERDALAENEKSEQAALCGRRKS